MGSKTLFTILQQIILSIHSVLNEYLSLALQDGLVWLKYTYTSSATHIFNLTIFTLINKTTPFHIIYNFNLSF